MKPKVCSAFFAIGTWGLILIAAGCIGKTEPSRFYSLSPEATASAGRPDDAAMNLCIGLGPIDFPEYLNRPQIVTRGHPNELQFSEFRRWGEPLSENFARTLSENLSRALRTDSVFIYPWPPQVAVEWQVLLDVQQFEGKTGDTVNLTARWVVADGRDDRVRIVRTSRITEPVDKTSKDPYRALVAAESRAVGALGEEIAREVRKLQTGP